MIKRVVPAKQLKLKTETVKVLRDTELQQVNGGLSDACRPSGGSTVLTCTSQTTNE
jgi:bacteriocin-like protein